MLKLNGKTCEHQGCSEPLVERQKRYCSVLHSSRTSRNYRDTATVKTWECRVCGGVALRKLSYCSNDCRLVEKRHHALSFCVVDGPVIYVTRLKMLLLRAGVLEAKCTWCGLTEWRGKSGVEAPLQLDHINGKKHDNRLENLRILCANCHSQTDTFCGRNKKKT